MLACGSHCLASLATRAPARVGTLSRPRRHLVVAVVARSVAAQHLLAALLPKAFPHAARVLKRVARIAATTAATAAATAALRQRAGRL